MIPIIVPESTPLFLKIIVAGIVIVGLFFFVRGYIRKGRL
jgi:hypothetical protein